MNRYKKIFSFILITAFLWNLFNVSITYGYFYLDEIGFIEQFCINKEKPELKCNGKCHLKEVAKKDASNDEAPLKMVTSKDITLFIKEREKFQFSPVSEFKKQKIYYKNLYSYISEYSLFHPPQLSLS